MTKGSTAIRIWAPWPPSKRKLHAWRDAGAGHDDKPRPGWRLASVFDKTRSPSLPRRHSPPRLGRRSPKSAVTCHEELVAELVSLADDIGYVVSFGDTGPAEGICHPESKRIAVAERLEANGRVVALIHELAHALVAQDPDAPRLDYAQGELIAEPVAYCCCQTVVLDSLFGELARTPLSERSAPRAPAECAAPA
jgi:hypothetical protein